MLVDREILNFVVGVIEGEVLDELREGLKTVEGTKGSIGLDGGSLSGPITEGGEGHTH